MRIRRATQQDCDALCEIQVSAIRELGGTHYSEAELAAWSRGRTPDRYERPIAEQYVIVAAQSCQIVGYGVLDTPNGKVGAIYVRPDFARQGVGTAILRELLREAKRNGLCQVCCESSLCAERFHAKAGFEAGRKCGRRFRSGEEIDCIPMTKSLD